MRPHDVIGLTGSGAFSVGGRRSPLPSAAGEDEIAVMLRQDFALGPTVRRFKSSQQQDGSGDTSGPEDVSESLRDQIDALIAALVQRTSGWGAAEMDARTKFGRLLKHGLDDAFEKARPVWPPKVGVELHWGVPGRQSCDMTISRGS